METSNLVNLLTKLNQIYPIGGQQTKTRSEISSERIMEWIWLATSILFVILFVMAGFHKFITPLPEPLRYLALIIACFTILLPNIAMLIDMGMGFFQLARFKTESFRLLLLEVQIDKTNVESIAVFERKTLEEAKEWLEIKCSRIKSKISLFFGNPEKIALFSLVGFGWMTFKEFFNGKIPESIPSVSSDPAHFILLIVVALFTGVSIGAMLLNWQLKRYTYYMEIIGMALKKYPK